jgi:hypothetical protein
MSSVLAISVSYAVASPLLFEPFFAWQSWDTGGPCSEADFNCSLE